MHVTTQRKKKALLDLTEMIKVCANINEFAMILSIAIAAFLFGALIGSYVNNQESY